MATRTVSSLKTGSGKSEPECGRFTRVLAVDTVPDFGLDMEVHASEAECAALAEACGLVAVHEFEANFHVRKQDRQRFKVTGSLRARVTQTCVVSLEPFEAFVQANIDVDFAPLGPSTGIAIKLKSTPAGGPAVASQAEEEVPDPIVDGKIDLGALATEFLILNLDLYPHKPGVSFNGVDVRGDPSDEASPFAVLRHRS